MRLSSNAVSSFAKRIAPSLCGVILFLLPASGRGDARPETWFHLIDGNVSREGLLADLDALASAGVGGIQFFHGTNGDRVWPGVADPIPCLSERWDDLVAFLSRECRRRGLTFKMQNCPGWSMSGGPWIGPDRAMRRLVAFPPGEKPAFSPEEDFREICRLSFPVEEGEDETLPAPVSVETNGLVFTYRYARPVVVRSVALPAPSKFNPDRCYDPELRFRLTADGRTVFDRPCPEGCWSDTWSDIDMTFDCGAATASVWRLEIEASHPCTVPFVRFSPSRRLDNWEAKAGRSLRGLSMASGCRAWNPVREKTLVFGHVNARRTNHPAPREATGWECDKLSAEAVAAHVDGYLGRLLAKGVKIDGALIDSWECGSQDWTWDMEASFERLAGYALRPWLPALFGYVVESPRRTERFLRDWRAVVSRMIEENYYGTFSRLLKARGLLVQYESGFGDVIAGDPMRFWRYADEPMCEFWSPFDSKAGSVYSHDFKPMLPCVSASHLYGKTRVTAEALTSFKLTFDENFRTWKADCDRHFGRGLTHVVFHTYTHNPVVGGKAPSTSFGGAIGSPFLRLQPWWPYLRGFTDYLARCGRAMERGAPVVDVLMYLGDEIGHKPHEETLLFGDACKYDYLNSDVLMNALEVRDGRLFSRHQEAGRRTPYRVLWIPEGTWLLPETERRLAELERQGARIVRGPFEPDWPSPLTEATGLSASSHHWYARQDGEERIFFVAEKNEPHRSRLVYVSKDRVRWVDPVTGRETDAGFRVPEAKSTRPVAFSPVSPTPVWATNRIYAARIDLSGVTASQRPVLSLGDVRDWASVSVDGTLLARTWCRPYEVDLSAFCGRKDVDVTLEVTSTIYNALVHDAGRPEDERVTWTIAGPSADAPFKPSGLLGPVTLRLH